MSITWDPMVGYGTSLRGYFDNSPWSFEETVARLKAASLQEPSEKADGDKTSVEFSGSYGGADFTLYDYKGDRLLHIGGGSSLNVEGLKLQLADVLQYFAPAAYTAREPLGYGGRSHSFGALGVVS